MNHMDYKTLPSLLAVRLCLLLTLAACPPLQAKVADINESLKQINSSLRSAEKDMFGGKIEKAVASLEDIKNLLLQVQQDDPNNNNLKQVQKKFEKLVKDLEHRTGKDLGGGNSTVAEMSVPATVLPAKEPGAAHAEKNTVGVATPSTAAPTQTSVATKLPHQARRPFEQASRGLENIEALFTNLNDPEYRGDKSQIVSRIDSALETIGNQLDEARKAAQNKGLHPIHPLTMPRRNCRHFT